MLSGDGNSGNCSLCVESSEVDRHGSYDWITTEEFVIEDLNGSKCFKESDETTLLSKG